MESINEKLMRYYSNTGYALESETKAKAMQMLKKLGDSKSSTFSKKFWQGKITDWFLKDENFKIKMFQFIDVLPTLKTSDELTCHIKSYFDNLDDSAAKSFIGFAAGRGLIARIAAGTLKNNITKMANDFIIGENFDKSFDKLLKLRKKGIGFTKGHL